MVFLVGASTTSGYEISNSLRLDSASSAYLHRNQVDPTSEGQIYTISVWNKICFPDGQNANLLAGGYPSGSGSSVEETFFTHNVAGTLFYQHATNDSTVLGKQSASLQRDVSAWYHFMLSVDTTQGTDTNRLKVYINNTDISADMTGGWPTQNVVHQLNQEFSDSSNQNTHNIGKATRGGNYSDMYIADFSFVDGTQLTPSSFGETNENGVWVPKKPSVSAWGDNGFFLEFKQTGTGTAGTTTIGADSSGNNNHFTTSGIAATDITTDTPTNNFCTLNPLINSAQDGAMSEGNTKLVSGSSSWGHKLGTMGVANGKWYYEAKVTSSTGSHYVGWQDIQPTQAQNAANPQSDSSGTTIWFTNTANDSTGHLRKNDSDDTAVSNAAIANGEIVGIALDLDSGTQTITIYKDGSAVDSDNTIASGNTGTLVPFIANATDGASIEVNFGNPPYANSSSVADANGYGAFEYAPPSGFYALCTKNLAKYG